MLNDSWPLTFPPLFHSLWSHAQHLRRRRIHGWYRIDESERGIDGRFLEQRFPAFLSLSQRSTQKTQGHDFLQRQQYQRRSRPKDGWSWLYSSQGKLEGFYEADATSCWKWIWRLYIGSVRLSVVVKEWLDTRFISMKECPQLHASRFLNEG